MKYSKVAGAIICFSRADYFKKTIESLEANEDAYKIKWHIFQDGIQNSISGKVYATEDQINSVRELVESTTLPIAEYVRQENNIGPGQQRYLALNLLNDYDLIFCFDDDMVVSKYYIRLLRIMAEQFPDHIGFLHRESKKSNNLRKLEICGDARLWGHYMNQQVYNKIKDKYKAYYDSVKKIDYHIRPDRALVRNKNVQHAMDDVVVNRLCRKVGIQKLYPQVSRGLYIGKNGMVAYKTPQYWKKKGMDRQEIQIEYDFDATLDKFKL